MLQQRGKLMSITNDLRNFIADAGMVFAKSDVNNDGTLNKEARDRRISSVALLVLGSLATFFSVSTVFTAVSLILNSSPFWATMRLTMAAITGILAYDLIAIGSNQSDRLNNRNVDLSFAGVFGGAERAKSGIPYELKDTLFAETAFKLSSVGRQNAIRDYFNSSKENS